MFLSLNARARAKGSFGAAIRLLGYLPTLTGNFLPRRDIVNAGWSGWYGGFDGVRCGSAACSPSLRLGCAQPRPFSPSPGSSSASLARRLPGGLARCLPAQRGRMRQARSQINDQSQEDHTRRKDANMDSSSSTALQGCVNSLRTSMQLLESSIDILDSGVHDYPRLSKVLQTTRVSN